MSGIILLGIAWFIYDAIRERRKERSATSMAPLVSEEPHNRGPVAGWMLGHQMAHGRADFPGDPLPDGHLGSARDLAFWGGVMDETDDERDE